MAAAIRYCTTEDGVRIAYSVEGEGPALVQCPAVWTTFAHNIPEWSAQIAPLLAGRRTVNYDPRGVGLSTRDPKAFTHDLMVRDLETVVQATGFQRFALYGEMFSVPWAIEYAARHPQRVDRLVLERCYIKGSDVTSRENLDAIVGLIRSNWEMASQMLSDQSLRETFPELSLTQAKRFRQDVSAAAAAQWLIDGYESTDVADLLPAVEAPTLILHRTGDSVFPFAAAQDVATNLRNAQLIALPGDGPIEWGEDGPRNLQAIVDFLDEGRVPDHQSADAAPGGLRTVLFTDIVGHTEMMQRLGDDRGRDVLREHERITRETLKAHGGAEVKTMGDGFMASFGSVTKAIDCAIALQRAFADWNTTPTDQRPTTNAQLHVRVGLNAGEPIEEDGDLFGSTVILASRIAAHAGPGEILIPEPLRHLLSGKSYVYADRGETMLKGFEDAVRLYEVRWRP